MIKSTLAFILLSGAASSASAFAVVTSTTRPSASRLHATTQRPDASAAIAEAMRISKEFGSHSPEAAVAWDNVEELSAANNAKNAFDIPSLDTECLVEEEISKACVDYGSKLDELAQVLAKTTPQINSLKAVADEMASIKLKMSSSTGKAAPDSPELRAALAEAKRISQEQGPTSPDAKVAWDVVEEIASAGLQNSLGGGLSDDECAVEEAAAEACKALEELSRALEAQKAKESSASKQ
ncbi:hypothetical protein MPSEU_000328100 [Mayamaea pseudoterrestris]|nr:hypothetical protein MPSEU_000328100 [Mayamaea pseudoterrestris]